ncbi:MAG: histidinol-phosphatase [Akkermansiaceae bacterium]|nr:histidinol-phosphatase [Akkermansiaceae bacterium]MCP5546067.1 histidinol-phosphatase [Akkermansiaceae bacterium]
MPEPLLYESHCHTPLCKHAYGEPDEYAAVALERGLKGITFTCHCPLPGGFSAPVRMAPEQFDGYVAMIGETRDRFAGKLDVRLGLECDFYPGIEDWHRALLARAPFSHVLGSIHYQIPEYRALFHPGDTRLYQEVYFDHLARSAESGLFDTLAHPDLIKNESPREWDFESMRPVIARALDRIAATGVAMELNTSGVEKRIPEMNPSPSMLSMMRERDIPVVIGADAHYARRVGDGYVTALRMLETAGYDEVSWFIDRKRRSATIKEALASLQM